MEYLAIVMSLWYNNLVRIPKWVLWIATGAIASIAMNVLHGKPKAPQSREKPKVVKSAAAPEQSSSSGSIDTKKARLRKGKK